jgi:hypothetical protein
VGFIFNFLAKDKAMGATIRTVATFSTNAEIKPVRRQMNNIAQAVFLALSTITSARYAGTRLSIKISATSKVPTNIPITFQLTAINASLKEIAPERTSRPAEKKATQALLRGRNTKSRYAALNIIRESILGCIVQIIY